MSEPRETGDAAPPRSAVARAIAITAAVATTALGLVTTALTPSLVTYSPLLLLALESPVRNMVLARNAPIVPFLLIATLRRTSAAVLFFFLGRWYGEDAVHWLERHAGRAGSAVRTAERLARVGSYPMVFFLPVPLVSVLAGSLDMPPRAFIPVSLVGSLCVALACRWLGDRLAVVLDPVLRVFARHGAAATAIATALVVVLVLVRLRGGSGTSDESP